MAKEPKILSMTEYMAGLVGAAAGSKAAAALTKGSTKKGGGLLAAQAGSKAARDLIKRKIGRAKGGAVRKKK
tara:strand:- start:54 stop:269 length:216 start_codon:yes stop_codon:yes gene_type:complete